MALIGMYCALGIEIPAFLLYDDACHLLGRMMSLMGTYWEAAAGVCMGMLLDKFHYKKYALDLNCSCLLQFDCDPPKTCHCFVPC